MSVCACVYVCVFVFVDVCVCVVSECVVITQYLFQQVHDNQFL